MIRFYTYFPLTKEIKKLLWKGKRERQARVKKKMNLTENVKNSKRSLEKEAALFWRVFMLKIQSIHIKNSSALGFSVC